MLHALDVEAMESDLEIILENASVWGTVQRVQIVSEFGNSFCFHAP